MASESERKLVKISLENYLKGHETGDPEFMRRAFYDEGQMTFVRDGKYAAKTFREFIAGFSGKPADDEAQRRRYIESIEITGNAAIGKIILDYPNGKFTDYMTLLKIDGEWKIVHKSFYVEQRVTSK